MISIQNLTVSYQNETVFNNLSLNINKGDFVGIIGPSGIGKSTLLRSIAGLIKPQTGSIYLNNQPFLIDGSFTNQTPKLQQEIGYIFQDLCLFPNLTVWENLEVVQKHRDSKQIETLLYQFDIYNQRNAYPDELSGGQKQRTSIARASILNPSVLLIDEATSALDETLTHEFMNYIQMLNQSGITILFITHQNELISGYCTKTYEFKNKNSNET